MLFTSGPEGLTICFCTAEASPAVGATFHPCNLQSYLQFIFLCLDLGRISVDSRSSRHEMSSVRGENVILSQNVDAYLKVLDSFFRNGRDTHLLCQNTK